MNAKYIIGIDTGVNTGIAVYDTDKKRLVSIDTVKIHRAMNIITDYHSHSKIFVRVEDARLRKWFGKSGREKLQGAGSIKRDSKIWDDFLTDKGIPFEMVAPKNNFTKVNSKMFKAMTGYTGRANEHGKAASMLVYGY